MRSSEYKCRRLINRVCNIIAANLSTCMACFASFIIARMHMLHEAYSLRMLSLSQPHDVTQGNPESASILLTAGMGGREVHGKTIFYLR